MPKKHRTVGHGVGAAVAIATIAFVAGCGSPGGPGRPGFIGDDAAPSAERIAALEAQAVEEPSNPVVPFRIAEIRSATGDPEGAEVALRRAFVLDPDHAPSLALLSKLWWEGTRHNDAIALLETHRASGSLPDELLLALALHYEAIDRIDVSDAIVESVAGRLSNWDSAGAAVTYLRLRGEDYRRSTDVADRALEARPESAVNQNNWGIARLYSGEPVEARKAFLTAVDLDPTLPGPLYNLAIVDKFYRFDDDSARDWFRRYLSLADEDPDDLSTALSVEITSTVAPANRAADLDSEGGTR